MKPQMKELGELISVGPAMLRDFALLGIRSVEQLAKQSPQRMYRRLEEATGERQDPCVLDVFCAAVAQARNPQLPAAQCQWWYWSRRRKERAEGKIRLNQRIEEARRKTQALGTKGMTPER